MKNIDTVKRNFSYQKEAYPNPYIGILSFQHFRGEALYSDCIVRPENNMTETENVECYPIPGYVPQNGRSEGYYPDSTMAYIRILWKEFEPERGEYNYKFIEDILAKAKAHGQSVVMRLMGHSTRACDDVPEWLKKLIPCPERPDGKRVKDSPTDPLYFELFLEAIKKLGEKFDSDPALYAFDISLPGSWGEGHKLELYSDEFIKNIVDTYVAAFPNTLLYGQSYLPEILHYANTKKVVGWRGDGLGDPHHMHDIYPPRIEKISDLWKTSPVAFESYWWLGEWKRKGWDIDEIIERTLEWHISSFNPKSMPIPFEWEEKTEYWLSKMGYHFVIDSFTSPEACTAGSKLTFELCTDNIGVAPIYIKHPLVINLCNESGGYVYDSGIDIRKWLPGKHTDSIEIELPESIPCGKYNVLLGICNENTPTVYFCTDAERDGGFYKLCEIMIK